MFSNRRNTMFASIKKFLGPAENSVKGAVDKNEVVRASVLSVISGGTIWVILSVLWAFIQSVITDPNFIINFKSFIDLLNEKNYLALFVAVSTFILDFIRRKYLHGK